MTRGLMGALIVVVVLATGAALAASNLQTAAVEGPLTQQQIEAALKVLTPRRVAGLIRERGTTFILDAQAERQFRALGSSLKTDSELLDEIVRLLAPPRDAAAGA